MRIRSLCAVLALALIPHAAASDRADHATIHLHYDYMSGAEPHPDSIRMVVEAFARRGIELRIDPHHTEIPASPYLSMGEPNCAESVDLYDLKATYFKRNDDKPWHYAVFGHGADEHHLCGAAISGRAELPGYNFMITAAQYRESWPPELYPYFEGGVLMHELGHNLGLHHGGPHTEDAMNYKPNYLSVMNGIYTNGIRFAAQPGSVEVAGRRLDYSHRALPALDEAHLDERVGVQAGSTDIVSYLCLPPGHSDPDFVEGLGPAWGPIDWNCNGVIESDVAHDIDVNFDSGSSCDTYPCYRVLTGHDDWTHVHAWIRGADYTSRAVKPRKLVH